jgi:hypothetical protein
MVSRSHRRIQNARINREIQLVEEPSGAQAKLWRFRKIPMIKFGPHFLN